MIMGCFKSKFVSKELEKEEPKYSWSNRQNINTSDLIIENLKNTTVIKRAGQVNGQQFIIQNCQNVSIAVLDIINTITVDECSNCSILIGPTKTSVVLRNCTNSRILCACQQFRSRDCQNLTVFLYCKTQPAIESCSNIKFACYSCHYKELKDQFKKADLNTFTNNWFNIYDFTINEDEHHWTLLPPTSRVGDYFKAFQDDIDLSFDPKTSVVPITSGTMPSHDNTHACLVLFHPDNRIEDTALSLIRDLQGNSIQVTKTKEFVLTKDFQRILGIETDEETAILIQCCCEDVDKVKEMTIRLPGVSFYKSSDSIYKQMTLINKD